MDILHKLFFNIIVSIILPSRVSTRLFKPKYFQTFLAKIFKPCLLYSLSSPGLLFSVFLVVSKPEFPDGCASSTGDLER